MRSYADPRKAVRMDKVRLGKFLRGYYRLTIEDRVIESIFRICQDAVKFYKSIRDAHIMPFDEEDVQKSIRWELDMLY